MVLSRNLVNVAVVLVVVLGSRNAGISRTLSSIIHGPTVYRLAKVGYEAN